MVGQPGVPLNGFVKGGGDGSTAMATMRIRRGGSSYVKLFELSSRAYIRSARDAQLHSIVGSLTPSRR
jgi:hypothetical protein